MKIKSITMVKPRKVYAITTSTKTFIADGLAHHNCVRCNIMLKGNYDAYNLVMLKKYGQEKIIEMLNQKQKVVKLDYEEICLKYKDKVKKLKESLKEKDL